MDWDVEDPEKAPRMAHLGDATPSGPRARQIRGQSGDTAAATDGKPASHIQLRACQVETPTLNQFVGFT